MSFDSKESADWMFGLTSRRTSLKYSFCNLCQLYFINDIIHFILLVDIDIFQFHITRQQ